MGFPGACLAARLETRVKRKGQWHREVVYLVSSLTLAELQAEGVLALKRGYWVVETRLHHCLDITLRENQSRVRTPRDARILGTLHRVVVSRANAAVHRARQKHPKTKCNTGTFQKRFRSARGGRARLHASTPANSPEALSLDN